MKIQQLNVESFVEKDKKSIYNNKAFRKKAYNMDSKETIQNNQNLKDLYIEYAYAFRDFSDFCNFISKYLIKQEKDIKKYIIKYIRKNLENNKINILLNYITSNININNNPYEEIMKIINWLREINYIPTSNLIIELLNKSEKFNYLITKIIEKDLDKIKKHKIVKKYDDELLMLFLEIYCTLNDIELDDLEEEKDNFEDIEVPVGFEAIISEIKRMDLEVLTKEEERDLLLKIKNGDQVAYQYFYEHNLRLVISIAKKYVNRGVPFEDLFQEGSIGLMLAIEHFELESGYKFSTYATCSIKRNIIMALSKYGRTIRIPKWKNSDLFRYNEEILELEKELGHELSNEEITKHLNMSIEEVQNNNILLRDCLSLNNRISEEDDAELGYFISDGTDIENDIFISDLSNEMKKLFKEAGLTKKELLVLKHRWGLDNVRKKTLVEIGNYFGVTKEYINYIESNAISKLRKCPFLVNFIYYLDYPDKAFKNLENLVSYQAIHRKSKFEKNEINTININKKNNIYSLTFNGKKYSKEEIDLAISSLDDLDKEILQLFYDINIKSTTINSADLNKYRDVLYERVIPNLGQILENNNAKKLSRK